MIDYANTPVLDPALVPAPTATSGSPGTRSSAHASVAIPNYPTAEFEFEVRTFRRIAKTLEVRRYCAATLTYVNQNQVPKSVLEMVDHPKDPRLRVSAPVRMRFKIVAKKNPDDPPGPKLLYVPLGIAFRRLNDLGRAFKDDVLGNVGRNVFHHVSVNLDQAAITVHDRYKALNTPDGGDGHHSYEFYILIQRLSDGELGIIDPGIDNKDPE